jgi:hypothetical protein
MTIKNSTVTREQYDALQADFESLHQSSTDNYAWRRGQVNALTRALKIRNRWVAALAIALIAQTVAIIWAVA